MASVPLPFDNKVSSEINPKYFGSEMYLHDVAICNMRIEFNRRVLANISASKGKNIWSQSFVNRIITALKTGNNYTESNIDLETYEVVDIMGTEFLMVSPSNDEPCKQVVPLEDSFNIIWKAHTDMGHPEHESLLEYLNSNYVINSNALQDISSICYICKAKGKFNARCAIYLIDMTSKVDYQFHHMLLYEDLQTGYFDFRPIRYEFTDMEVALEIMKIFMEFGPPANIEIVDPIIKVALGYVEQMLPFKFNVVVREIQWKNDVMIQICSLKRYIFNWLEVNKVNNWGFGCLLMQWALNHTKTSIDGVVDTPWNRVFGMAANSNKLTFNDFVTTPAISCGEDLDSLSVIEEEVNIAQQDSDVTPLVLEEQVLEDVLMDTVEAFKSAEPSPIDLTETIEVTEPVDSEITEVIDDNLEVGSVIVKTEETIIFKEEDDEDPLHEN